MLDVTEWQKTTYIVKARGCEWKRDTEDEARATLAGLRRHSPDVRFRLARRIVRTEDTGLDVGA